MTNLPAPALKRDVSRYASIDQVLGDSRGRYFGAGFRQIRQEVLDVRIDTQARTIHAAANIVYPSMWSTKKNRALQPHLSSIDVFMIGAQLCELYLREAYGIEALTVRLLWLRRCVLKAGSTPTLDLEGVPASLSLTRTERAEDSLCGHLSSFTGRIGSMSVEFVIDHPLITTRDVAVRYESAVDLLGAPDQRYYGSAYTNTHVLLHDIELDVAENSARARLGLEHPAPQPSLQGMGAAYVPFVSALNGIVSVAQLAQALLYHYDDISREASNNLWMRKIAFSSPTPSAPGRAMPVETWCTKTSLLPIKDTLWRSSNFLVTLPGIQGEYSLAHQLPSNSR